ncbi:DUF3307 domain-containing protein [Prolixibacter denitrificans]|uniref:Uncharacterized protein DUF3307 n=1 Tax=Prolixibacter denitrificans TaxID=1541063 RepID=A0A2P8C7V9_9BACT|nr:DUF3307 domain-containing protein [Prolixibacter denitrificans]PSK81060.1 uncharacterized protein DUF3307 [Prolixibacter denitrificans]GET22178.1 hypothetical protein JCM18694_24240 [Prolixibacter denitrificans]
MMINLLFLQLTAHLVADFLLQSEHWSLQKEKKIISKIHIFHILIVFASSWLFSLQLAFWSAALALTVLHFLTDVIKSLIRVKWNKDWFFIDQFAHIIIITAIVWFYVDSGMNQLPVFITPRIAAIIFAYTLCVKPSNIIIRYIFRYFSVKAPAETEEENGGGLPNAGKLIGITERLLVLTLVLLQQYSVVGFIIAAKSILRFSDAQKTEYVLVGTLLSFGIAILMGVMVSYF